MQEPNSPDSNKRPRMEEDDASRKSLKNEDPNVRDARGLTPLLQICMKPNLTPEDCEEIRDFLQKGADPNLRDGFGKSPLSLVCEFSGELSVVEDLIKFNADVSAKDTWGRTPLHWCCDRGRFEVAELLISHSANVNAITEWGDSPLLWASKSENEKIVELLLNSGCDVHIKNNRNETAISVAANQVISTLISSKTHMEDEEELGQNEFPQGKSGSVYSLNGFPPNASSMEGSSSSSSHQGPNLVGSSGPHSPHSSSSPNPLSQDPSSSDSIFDFLTQRVNPTTSEAKPFSMFAGQPPPPPSNPSRKLKISLKKK